MMTRLFQGCIWFLVLCMQLAIIIIFTFCIIRGVEYYQRWTPKSNKRVPLICFVAVKLIPENKLHFIHFSELSEFKKDYIFLVNGKGKMKVGMDQWDYKVNDDQKIEVNYIGDDATSFFKYQINDNIINPLSCKQSNPGVVLFGFFLACVFLVIGRFVFRVASKKYKRNY